MSAAPIKMWRVLIIKVTAIISKEGSGLPHKPTAANSEPPAKFSPVISGISSTLMPFCAPCTPKINAKGNKPISMGRLSFTPRRNSVCGEVSAGKVVAEALGGMMAS